jgi:hypothetical protein
VLKKYVHRPGIGNAVLSRSISWNEIQFYATICGGLY